MSGERGSGSALALATVALVLAAGALATGVALAVNARHYAAVAADAAALAAASHATAGPGVACERAARVARANGVRLQACALDGAVASVAVEATVRLPWIGHGGAVRLNARAGPAETNRDKAAPVVRPS